MSGRVNEYMRTQEYQRLAIETQSLKSEFDSAKDSIGKAQEAEKAAEQKAKELESKANAFQIVAEEVGCQTKITGLNNLCESELKEGQQVVIKGEKGTHPDECLRSIKSVELVEEVPEPEEEEEQAEPKAKTYTLVLTPSAPVVVLDQETHEQIEEIKVIKAFGISFVPANQKPLGDLYKVEPITDDDPENGLLTADPVWVKLLNTKPSLGSVDSSKEFVFKVSNAGKQLKIEVVLSVDAPIVLQAIPAQLPPEPEKEEEEEKKEEEEEKKEEEEEQP